MNVKALRVFYSLFLVLVSIASVSADRGVTVAPAGKTVVDTNSGKEKILVEIITHNVNSEESDRENKNIPATACTYSRFPCSIIENLRISVSGKPIYVQHSVFLDLADVNIASITAPKNGYLLRLEAGDASETYVAIIEFDKTRIKSKRIFAGGGGGILEDTTYHVVTIP